MPPYPLTINSAASKNLMVLLEPVLTGATTDSQRGRSRGRFNSLFSRKPTLPRRGLKNLRVLLVLHSCRMKHPVEALRWGALSISSIYKIFMVFGANTLFTLISPERKTTHSRKCHERKMAIFPE
jgi:hypothetical protein